MFNSLSPFFTSLHWNISPKGQLESNNWTTAVDFFFPILSLRDAQSLIGAVRGGIGGSLSEAKAYGRVPLTMSHGSLLDTTSLCACSDIDTRHLYITAIKCSTSRHMLTAWLCGTTVYRGFKGFDWPLVVVVSWYWLTQTHDLRNRWIKEACNPINLVLSQNTHQCSMHRLNCAWSLQTCMKCCSSVCNKAFSLWFPNGVGVFWSKPV